MLAMRFKNKVLLVYGTLLVAVVAAGTMGDTEVSSKCDTTEPNTRTVTVQLGDVSSTVSASGNLQPVTTTPVSFGASGRITEIDVTEGQTVTQGQVLAKVDPTTAQTNLTVAQLNYSAASVALTNAQNATNTTGTVPSSLYSAEASAVQAQTALTNAQLSLLATTLTAPVAGRVTGINYTVGR